MNKKDEERVREIVREELKAAVAGAVATEVASATKALALRNDAEPINPFIPPSAGRRSALEIDNIVDELEHEGYAGLAVGFQARTDLGMSPALAEVKTKIAEGYDLTPMGFELPQPESYFIRFRHSRPSFQDHFTVQVENGSSIDDAYEFTCGFFGVPAMRKVTRKEKALAELPDAPRGAFSLGRGEAAAKAGLGSLGSGSGVGGRRLGTGQVCRICGDPIPPGYSSTGGLCQRC